MIVEVVIMKIIRNVKLVFYPVLLVQALLFVKHKVVVMILLDYIGMELSVDLVNILVKLVTQMLLIVKFVDLVLVWEMQLLVVHAKMDIMKKIPTNVYLVKNLVLPVQQKKFVLHLIVVIVCQVCIYHTHLMKTLMNQLGVIY